MNIKRAKNLLYRCRRNGHREHQHDLDRVMDCAEKHPELEVLLAQQTAFDDTFSNALESIDAPQAVREKFEGIASTLAERRGAHHFSFRNPAVLAVFLALLILAFLGTWLYLTQSQNYPGSGEVEAVVKKALASTQFEPVVTKVGTLGDWFSLKEFDGFYVPNGLEEKETTGVGIISFEGQQVAAVSLKTNKLMFLVFPASSLGVRIEPEGEWKITDSEEGEIAAQMVGGMVFVLYSRDPHQDVSALIRSLPKSKSQN